MRKDGLICPKCGEKEVSVRFNDNKTATVSCGNCNISLDVPTNGLTESVDAYGDFIDTYHEMTTGKTIVVSLEVDDKENIKKKKTGKDVFGENVGFLEF